MNNQSNYSYENAGFDNFLSRSVDDLSQTNLESVGPQTTQLRFDSAQVSGALGDTLRLGRIYLNGAKGAIIMNDGNNDVLLIGDDDG
jgi:hypothetical protein